MAKPKQIAGIKCHAAAAAGIRLVLVSRLKEMCARRDDALDSSNPEGVHDMRVASRRLRSALRDFMPYLRKRRLSSCLQEIKNFADALGNVRDQDVAILALEKLAQKAPPLVVSSINEFAAVRRQKREEARAVLSQLLDPDALSGLRSSFGESLEAALAPKARKKSKQGVRNAAMVSYREVARTTILVLLEDLEELSDSLHYPLNVKPIHRMRIAAKRLRYAIELFGHCWGQQVAVLAKKVANLQSSLGELHDCDLWIDSFGDDLSRARKHQETSGDDSGQADPEEASVWLQGHFVKLRTKHFLNSLACWREWEAKDVSAQLRRALFAELSEAPSPPHEKAHGKLAHAASANEAPLFSKFA